MLPSCYGYVRGWTRTWHLIDAPLSSVQPWRDPKVTKPAVCGRAVPADMGEWGTICGSVWEGAKVCRRCVRKALKGAKREEAGR